MSKNSVEETFTSTLERWIILQEQEALTAKQWQLVHKVKYYLKKYKTEINQLELNVDGAG